MKSPRMLNHTKRLSHVQHTSQFLLLFKTRSFGRAKNPQRPPPRRPPRPRARPRPTPRPRASSAARASRRNMRFCGPFKNRLSTLTRCLPNSTLNSSSVKRLDGVSATLGMKLARRLATPSLPSCTPYSGKAADHSVSTTISRTARPMSTTHDAGGKVPVGDAPRVDACRSLYRRFSPLKTLTSNICMSHVNWPGISNRKICNWAAWTRTLLQTCCEAASRINRIRAVGLCALTH